ncbi:hypothetical protein [Thioalkalivibrio sulfidiphilus]|uniref:hypothetical protein n=1 Tax=Thioalkalivibrio sulfidiphilus TaxID=1033854 RepID=UPI0016507A26|nr:hypothetical protein [Thioalkalivibrio sulfidiphilus]
MKIGSPRIFNQIDQAVFEADIESSRGKHILRYTLDRAYSAFLTDSLDACLIALLMPAMELGEDIHLDGHVSERLLLNASGPLQALLKGYTDLMVDGAPLPHQSDTTLRWLIDRLRS